MWLPRLVWISLNCDICTHLWTFWEGWPGLQHRAGPRICHQQVCRRQKRYPVNCCSTLLPKKTTKKNKNKCTLISQTALWYRSLKKTVGLNTQSQPHWCAAADWPFMGGNAAPVSQHWSHPCPPYRLQSPNHNIDRNALSPVWEGRHLLWGLNNPWRLILSWMFI